MKVLFGCFPSFVMTINVCFVLPVIGCFVLPIKYTFNRDLRGALGGALTDLSGLPGLPVRLPGYPVSTRLPGYPVYFGGRPGYPVTRLPGYPMSDTDAVKHVYALIGCCSVSVFVIAV